MLFYPAALPLSSQTLNYTAGVIRRHRRQIGSCWRKLNPGRQALLVLAYLRKGETFAELAAGFGVGTATAWRYVSETVALLAARSPKLRQALAGAKKAGHAYVVIDGTLIPIDRVAADRPFYSGKHRRHGMNLQVIARPEGEILWVSGPLPGAVHDLTAARIWGILRELAAARLIVLADKGYAGAGGHVRIPYRGRGKPASQKDANRTHAQLRSPRNAPTPSSRPGASCANSAAVPGGPGNWPKPSMSFKPARSEDEKELTGSPGAGSREPGAGSRGSKVGRSGGGGQVPPPGQDLGQESVAGIEPQGQVAGVAGQPAGDGDEPPAQGGDHGLAAAHAVPGQDVPAGGELVQPGGNGRGEQRAPHPVLAALVLADHLACLDPERGAGQPSGPHAGGDRGE